MAIEDCRRSIGDCCMAIEDGCRVLRGCDSPGEGPSGMVLGPI